MNKDINKKKSSWVEFIGKETKLKMIFIISACLICVGLIVTAIFTVSGGGMRGGGTYQAHGRIVIAADSKGLDGIVSATFERCRYLIVYDLAKNKFNAVVNPYFSAVDPGDQAARFIADRAEEAVITGNIGPQSYQTLENFNIQVYLVPKMTIRKAIEKFLAGKLIHMGSQTLYGYTTPSAQQSLQAVAWQSPPSAVVGPREAVCPVCQLRMPIGAHIQINRIMCPYCPGQVMKIIDSNTTGQQAPSRGARTIFMPGGGAVGRGVVVLR